MGSHHHETEHVYEPHEGGEDPRVPPLVLLVEQGVHAVPGDEGHSHEEEVRGGDLVVLLCFGLLVRRCLDPLYPAPLEADCDGLGYLPRLDRQSHTVGHKHHEAGVVVSKVE